MLTIEFLIPSYSFDKNNCNTNQKECKKGLKKIVGI